MTITRNSSSPGWILVSGLMLFAMGLEARSQDEDDGFPTQTQAAPLVPLDPAYGTSDSNASMIAVTGPSLTGGSVLYLVDTRTRRLSVYQATGGSKSTMSVEWVGARNIDLDLQVNGWNDKSEYSFSKLESEFEGGQVPEKVKR